MEKDFVFEGPCDMKMEGGRRGEEASLFLCNRPKQIIAGKPQTRKVKRVAPFAVVSRQI